PAVVQIAVSRHRRRPGRDRRPADPLHPTGDRPDPAGRYCRDLGRLPGRRSRRAHPLRRRVGRAARPGRGGALIERVEVTAGTGTVIRYGGIVAWADPSASAALISFLAQSARNLSPSPRGGRQIADHIASVLTTRDPEPHVAFAVVGPSDHGWA